MHLTIMELPTQFTMGLSVQAHDDHAGRVAIESMDDAGPGEFTLHARGEAILLVRPDPRHGQQPGGLVEHENSLVLMNDVQGHRQLG